jgi:Flp pilus assembly protein TadG
MVYAKRRADAPGRCERGSVTIMFALTSMVAFGFVGLALDYNRAVAAKQKLQMAVDQSAIAGASLPATANQNRIGMAQKFFGTNLIGSPLASVVPAVQASNAGVTVTATHAYPTILMKLWRVDSLDLIARSVARSQVQNGGVACMIALNPTTDNDIHLQGVNKLSSTNCWAWVNSTHAYSINAVGASLGTAQGFCTAGGVLGGEHFLPAPYTECDPIPDPFADKTAPASNTCTHTNTSLKNGTFTLSPGVYCGGLVLKPQAEVTFNPGVYIIKNGMFEIQGQASAAGNGVVFVFVGSDAEFIVRGGGSVSFTAPDAAATNVAGLNGFVLFQDKTTTTAGKTTVIQGGGDVKIEGILYMPTWRVDIGGNGDVNQAAKYFAMVADSFYMEGNGKLYVASDAAGANLPDLMPRIRNGPQLVE